MKDKFFNEKLYQLAEQLNDLNYHDERVLGENLEITRSALSKMIKKLQNYGIEIEAIQERYRLKEPLMLLHPEIIRAALSENIEIIVLESTTSTNDYFTAPKTKSCCLAEHQTQGRGRFSRVWHSPFGKNIYLSFCYPFEKDMSELSGLSLVISLAITAALKTFGLDNIKVKWPNDILCNNKKIAGILISILKNEGYTATIGIGLNVNMRASDAEEITQPWTSLYEQLQRSIDRNQTTIVLLLHLLDYLERFKKQGFSAFFDEWDSVDALAHQEITLESMSERISGKVLGINAQGHIQLRLSNGNIEAFSAGDVTIKKVI